ncbi:gamma-glutamyltransferase [Phenylobacterium sp. LjRoot225]|uniref:gamma-glutamyltransferase n=1 Tax=Phenylobacterium sp. LjRoot225 TaxID=3342285 RepID=UPI003ECF82A4
MEIFGDPYSSRARPVLSGLEGAVAAAHPLAVAAGQELLLAGGSAADAAIAAQAALCVLAPDACGLGGDMLALVREPGARVAVAVNGAGCSPAAMTQAATDGANSVTVPGLVDAWTVLSERWGRLPLASCLAPAIGLARQGVRVTPMLAATVRAQAKRLLAGGAADWSLLHVQPGELFRQEALALWLEEIGRRGSGAFYLGERAAAIAGAVQLLGGALSVEDLAAHETVVAVPLTADFRGAVVAVQPPATQGVLLTMVLQALERLGRLPPDKTDHAAIELTEAAFTYRSHAGEGAALMALDLPIDLERAGRRGSTRAYLHTAGVATADADGMVVSSLVSVFDDFGSCVYVPECGVTLNNRAGGFTDGANAAGPGKRPVHTLAPAMVFLRTGDVLGLATPGADGQVQTLVQVLAALTDGVSLATAIDRPRWRSQAGELLIEAGHPQAAILQGLGHLLRTLEPGDVRFGAVVCAGVSAGSPLAAADWRRETWAGVV